MKITNAVLAEKITNLSKYLHERNDLQDKRLDKYSAKIDKNAINIASIKGVAGIISAFVSFIIAGMIAYFATSGSK